MFTPRHKWMRLTNLLLGLLCLFNPVSSISFTVADGPLSPSDSTLQPQTSASAWIATADLGNGPLHTDTIISSPDQIEQPASLTTPPRKAYDLLKQLEERGGVPLPGYVGGRNFQNRERRLPRGYYREYDVNPKIRGRRRDAERIVIEQRTGKAYYTGDHYRTFVPLN